MAYNSRKKATTSGGDPTATEAIEKMHAAIEGDDGSRSMMIEDLKFSYGDQWPAEMKMERQLDRRPCLTINKTDSMVRMVLNNMRQQRPRIKVHPVSDGADQQKAEVIEGLMRHIWVRSNADQAIDIMANFQVRCGLGYIRILTKYESEKSFDQEVCIEQIRNPFSVYFDPASIDPAGLDAEWVVIADSMRREDFERQYPDFTGSEFSPAGQGNVGANFSSKNDVFIAEYYRFKHKNDTLFQLADGRKVFKSDLPEGKKVGDFVENTIIIKERPSVKKQLCWSKVTNDVELEYRELPGAYIPVLRAIGGEMLHNGRYQKFGMVRNMKDPQMMYNYWRTQETEFVALAPKAPWLVFEGQTENHEEEWANANIRNYSTLTTRVVYDQNGQPLPPPQRIQPQTIPAASVNAAMSASEDIKSVAGMFDPALGAPGQETSGDMVARRQSQSDLSNYHFYDNLTVTIRGLGCVILDLLKYYYDGERIVRIIQPSGTTDMITINRDTAEGIVNDVSTGIYDVVMETGPGYDTKREEASDKMLQLLRYIPQVGQIAADIIVGQMDFPESQRLVERLQMANPLAKLDSQLPEDMDPKIKPFVMQLMGQLKQTQAQLQQLQQEKAAKVIGIQEKEQAVTQRDAMKQHAETGRMVYKEHQENMRHAATIHKDIADTTLRGEYGLEEVRMDINADLKLHHEEEITTRRGQPYVGNRNV